MMFLSPPWSSTICFFNADSFFMFSLTVDFWTLPVEGFEVFNPVMLPDGNSAMQNLGHLDNCRPSVQGNVPFLYGY